jgi:hypothetical protein
VLRLLPQFLVSAGEAWRPTRCNEEQGECPNLSFVEKQKVALIDAVKGVAVVATVVSLLAQQMGTTKRSKLNYSPFFVYQDGFKTNVT